MPATKAKASFSAVLARAGYQGERIVIKKGARPTAVILGYEDYQRLVDLEDRCESALLTKSLDDDRFLILNDVTKRLSRSSQGMKYHSRQKSDDRHMGKRQAQG